MTAIVAKWPDCRSLFSAGCTSFRRHQGCACRCDSWRCIHDTYQKLSPRKCWTYFGRCHIPMLSHLLRSVWLVGQTFFYECLLCTARIYSSRCCRCLRFVNHVHHQFYVLTSCLLLMFQEWSIHLLILPLFGMSIKSVQALGLSRRGGSSICFKQLIRATADQ